MAHRAVVIEDEAVVRETLGFLLGRAGYETIRIVPTATEGMVLCEHLDPDVVLLDTTFVNAATPDAAAERLKLRPTLGIVLHLREQDLEFMPPTHPLTGIRGYALKHGPGADLLAGLEAVAAGGNYVDQRLIGTRFETAAFQRPSRLSKRELEVLTFLAEGLTGEQIARQLVLSSETVKTHVRNAMVKLEAHTRVHAVAIALTKGCIRVDTTPGQLTAEMPAWQLSLAQRDVNRDKRSADSSGFARARGATYAASRDAK